MSRLRLIAGLTGLIAAEQAVLAQQRVPPVEQESAWIAVLIAMVLLLGAAVASLMTPKRTHQD